MQTDHFAPAVGVVNVNFRLETIPFGTTETNNLVSPQDSPRSVGGFLDEPVQPSLQTVLNENEISSVETSDKGTGGVYFVDLNDDQQTKVVFKPAAEENETTGGNGFLKEFSAYLIDDGLSGVPETCVSALDIHGTGAQVGSVQQYVDGVDAEDFGPGVFSKEDIHRIGVLDVRIANQDRHSGNIMRSKGGKLVPIDHGSSFANALEGELANINFEWLMYPQSKQPFDAQMLESIKSIDVESDISKLSLVGLDEGSQLSTWMSTTLLKMAAARGLTLFQIGSMMQRQGDRQSPSTLEKLFRQAADQSSNTASRVNFFDKFTQLAAEQLTNTL